MPRDGHATVVVAPDDEQLGAELSRCAQIGTGVAVVRPVPRVATRDDVAPDVLMAMGKHFDCLDRERRRPRAWDLAALWLRAERVRHLVIAHADHVAIFLWQDFSDLARAAGADLWLIVGDTSRSRSTPTVMGDVALRWSDAGSLLKALPQAVPDPAPYRPLAMPLPDDDFLTFGRAVDPCSPPTALPRSTRSIDRRTAERRRRSGSPTQARSSRSRRWRPIWTD